MVEGMKFIHPTSQNINYFKFWIKSHEDVDYTSQGL